jgi:hypothetical protein
MNAFAFGLDETIKTIHGQLEWLQFLPCPVLNIPYEIIEDRPLRAILMIQHYLNGRVDTREARRRRIECDKAHVKQPYDCLPEGNETVSIGVSYYNATTFYHRRHVSSVSKREISTTLNAEQIATMRQQLCRYVDASGTYTPASSSRVPADTLRMTAHSRKTAEGR